MNMRSQFKQQGLSLIELMISITLGSVLMGAALQVMLSNSQTYQLNDDISRIQENGRIALDIISQDLRMAGYRQPLNGNGLIPDFVLKDCTTNADAGEACADDPGGAASDRLSIQFDPPPDNGTERTCLGELVSATDIIVNVYTVEVNDGISSLYCRTYNATTQAWTADPKQPLVDGIDNMQLLYGIADNTGSTTKYVPKGELTTDADWLNIRAIRVALLVSNGLATGSANNKLRTFRLLDSAPIPYTDRHTRRIYSTTVQFNN
jgi:type IV pilus assembly protein PilW